VLQPSERVAAQHRRAVLLVSRARLQRRYGARGLARIMQAVAGLVRALGTGLVQTLCVDDEKSMAPLGLEPVSATNPAKLERLVGEYEALHAAGEPVAVWLLGDHELVPPFVLENPASDCDAYLVTDVPYSGLGPGGVELRRPVARIIGEPAHDESGLLGAIHRLNAYASSPWHVLASRARIASGYSALVWRQAARVACQPVIPPEELRLSPPLCRSTYHELRRVGAWVRYFNLHGKQDGRVWYGQVDELLRGRSEQFPAAVTAQDVTTADAANCLVLTEACYGATLRKGSIARKFLRHGATVIGSTAMSYGALEPPLVGADLLSQLLLQGLSRGLRADEALLRAQRLFVATVAREQGFLDAEDRKTVLTFVLLGNPLFRLAECTPREETPETGEPGAVPLQTRATCSRSYSIHAVPHGLREELEYVAHLSGFGPEDRFRQGTCNGQLWQEEEDERLPRSIVVRGTLPTGAERVVRFTLDGNRVGKVAVSR
jgi:hypothetical protein